MGITTIASCLSPTITGTNVARAFQMLRGVVDVPPIAERGERLVVVVAHPVGELSAWNPTTTCS